MADEINTNKPNVGIRGNAQELPVLKRRESLVAGGSTPNFGAALNALATTPTVLGEIGSQLQVNSSIALATKFGQSLGKNPQGNLLPPITNFDKSVSEAYNSQAQVTIGNNANAMMYQAQEEMSKANKLTPDLINAYKQNMAEGLQQSIDLAPDALKPGLERQFGHQLQSTTHELNQKLISQNKADAESKAAVWRTHQNDLVTNMVKDAKTPEQFENAKNAFESLQENIHASNLSPAQKDTALTTSKLNYQTALSIQKVMNARSSGNEAEYLASIADKKIEGLSWSESEQVRDNTVRYLSAVQTAENSEQNLIMSQAGLDMAEGSFNESKLAALRDSLRPQNYNTVATNWAVKQHTQNKENIVQQRILSNPRDATSYSGLQPKQIDAGFDLITNAIKAKNPGISQTDAEFQAASNMSTVIPKFVDGINRKLSNGNPQQVLEAKETYERLHELDGNKVLGINEKSLAVADVFTDLLASQPADIDQALTQARETVFNQDKDIIKATQAQIHSFMIKHAANPSARLSTAVSLSGLNSSTNIDNPAAFQADVFSRFNGYMLLTRGNEEVSKLRTQKDAAKIWGESRVNGSLQNTRLGIEQAIGLPTNAAPLIQEDVMRQLIPQLENSKKLFDMGGSPHYWRIKEGRIDYNAYAEAKLAINKKGLSDPKYAFHKQTINKYEEAPPIIIEQVTKTGIVEWNLDVQTSPYAQRSPKTGQVTGYNIGIKHPETGEQGQLYGFYGNTHNIPSYSPNEKWLKENYIGLNNPGGISIKQYIEERKLHEQDQPQDVLEYRQMLRKK